jgi:hypothetical protein
MKPRKSAVDLLGGSGKLTVNARGHADPVHGRLDRGDRRAKRSALREVKGNSNEVLYTRQYPIRSNSVVLGCVRSEMRRPGVARACVNDRYGQVCLVHERHCLLFECGALSP